MLFKLQPNVRFYPAWPRFKNNARTEYWVSQTRKYCEFCKCTIADNKPSVQFHESGKKHKENVRLRLAEMQKKATKDASSAATVEKQMKKMEEAAMKAYMKDIEANPDFTSKMIKETLEANKASINNTPNTDSKKEMDSTEAARPIGNNTKKKSVKKWMEAKTAEGYTYYWHAETGESIWEAPKGFISVEKQEAPNPPASPKPSKAKKKEKLREVKDINHQIYGSSSIQPVVKEEYADIPEPSNLVGPIPRAQPYGSWTTVVKEEKTMIDLELPEVKPQQLPVVSVQPEDKPKGFKEKRMPVSSFPSQMDTVVAFKKRKFGAARNARQRKDDN